MHDCSERSNADKSLLNWLRRRVMSMLQVCGLRTFDSTVEIALQSTVLGAGRGMGCGFEVWILVQKLVLRRRGRIRQC
jgi:hypothetical protein